MNIKRNYWYIGLKDWFKVRFLDAETVERKPAEPKFPSPNRSFFPPEYSEEENE